MLLQKYKSLAQNKKHLETELFDVKVELIELKKGKVNYFTLILFKRMINN